MRVKMDIEKKLLKIAMIGHKYVPSREGGVEIVVENLANEMALSGNYVTLFNRKRKEYSTISEYNNCKIENIFTINKKSLDAIVYSFFATIRAKKMAQKGKFDILHFHAEGSCLFLNFLPKRKKRKYKIIVTIHGLDWKRGKWGKLASKFLLKGEKRAVKYADEIIVLSENNKKYFKEKYNRETVFIPNGVNLSSPRETDIIYNKWKLIKDSYILFLARIVPEKGLHYLVKAWKEVVKKTHTDKKLVIAGGSSHTDSYFNCIYEMCKDDITIIMTGFVQGQVLEELYSNAYLYVLPSDIEGMPMSLLEAMSFGNICLVSDIPENTEVINDECFVFEKGNVDSLRDQIINLINLNMQTHTKIFKTYDWKEVANKTLELYSDKL